MMRNIRLLPPPVGFNGMPLLAPTVVTSAGVGAIVVTFGFVAATFLWCRFFFFTFGFTVFGFVTVVFWT
jgi:hypothetical protein